jgi:hypothetical protein
MKIMVEHQHHLSIQQITFRLTFARPTKLGKSADGHPCWVDAQTGGPVQCTVVRTVADASPKGTGR